MSVNGGSHRFTSAVAGYIPRLQTANPSVRTENTSEAIRNQGELAMPEGSAAGAAQTIRVEVASEPGTEDRFVVPFKLAPPLQTEVRAASPKPFLSRTSRVARLFWPFGRQRPAEGNRSQPRTGTKLEGVRVMRNDLTDFEVDLVDGRRVRSGGFLSQFPEKAKGTVVTSKSKSWFMAKLLIEGRSRP